MLQDDPLQKIESKVKDIHDLSGKYTRPVLSRYPLLFAFLLTFGVAAILHGFELWADQIAYFHEHPGVLMLLGIGTLAITGTLYKSLGTKEYLEPR